VIQKANSVAYIGADAIWSRDHSESEPTAAYSVLLILHRSRFLSVSEFLCNRNSSRLSFSDA